MAFEEVGKYTCDECGGVVLVAKVAGARPESWVEVRLRRRATSPDSDYDDSIALVCSVACAARWVNKQGDHAR